MHISKKMNLWLLAERMGDMATERDAYRMRQLLLDYGFAGFDTSDVSAQEWESFMHEAVEGVD